MSARVIMLIEKKEKIILQAKKEPSFDPLAQERQSV